MPSVRDLIKNATMDVAQTLCKDATYIPAEKLDWKPEGHGKSANEILSECAKVNLMMVAAINGTSPNEAQISADFEGLKACVISSAQEVCNAIDSLSDEAMESDVTMPWGAMMSTMQAVMLPASHMSYHDGQINYIQLLLGDTAFHWAEG